MLSNPRVLKLTAAGIAIAVVGVALLLRFQSLDLGTRIKESRTAEDPLDKARGILRQARDLAACRAALQQVNSYLARERNNAPAPLDAKAREELRRQFELTDAELEEIVHPSFTLLDGIHLEMALLMRDAARSLAPDSEAGAVRVPEQEAAALFGWVVRQVQFPNRDDLALDSSRPEMAPQLGLRRSVASPLVRALLFAALAEQAGLDACLLSFPLKPGEAPRYWGCGVLGSGSKIYVFDPRLGLPLPGPEGTGIASLDQLAAKDSPALKQLDLSAEIKYDVTPEIAAGAELHLFISLSALTPRMRFLDREVLHGIGGGHAAADRAGLAERFRAALEKSGGPARTIKPAAWAVRLQRDFFPKEEGGANTDGRLVAFRRTVAYANLYPLGRALRDSLGEQFHGTNAELIQPPLFYVFDDYLKRFLDFFLGPSQPRELLLRGDLDGASRQAGDAYERFQLRKDIFRTNFSREEVKAWYNDASRATAAMIQAPNDPGIRAAIIESGRKYDKTLTMLVEGSASEELLVHVSYLRALIKHEQAERLRLGPASSKADLEEARQAWKEAVVLWSDSQIRNQHPQPGREAGPLKARAQQKLAEVLSAQARTDPAKQVQAGEALEAAAALWEDLLGMRKDLEALGYRWQLKQLRK